MSAADAGRVALTSYYKMYYDLTEELKGVSGVVRAGAIRIANYPYLHSMSGFKYQQHPFRYMQYLDRDNGVDILIRKIQIMLKAFPTVKQLGLDRNQLLEMDYTTFCETEELICEMCEDKNSRQREEHNELEESLGL